MQIAKDGSAEDAASQSCAHISLGSQDLLEGEEYTDEDLVIEEQMETAEAETYDEIQGGENEEEAVGEVVCEELPSGKLSCTNENGQPLSGCVADEEGYVICD